MSRQHSRIIRQNKQFISDITDNLLETLFFIVAGKIRSSDRPSEKRIAAKENFFFAVIKANPAWRMAGRMNKLKLEIGEFNFLFFVKDDICRQAFYLFSQKT